MEVQPSFSQQVEGNQGNSQDYPNSNTAKSSTMEQRRKLGLCFKCGDKFSPGHQFWRLLLHMEGLEEGKEEGEKKVVLQEETGGCKMMAGEVWQKLL